MENKLENNTNESKKKLSRRLRIGKNSPDETSEKILRMQMNKETS